MVRVPDARLALAHLSAAFYGHPSRELTLVGITGTNGKTTTTYLLEAILQRGRRIGGGGGHRQLPGGQSHLAGSGDHPRIPGPAATLEGDAPPGVSHVFMEVSSHALDLHRVDCARFAAGVFTNLSQDHLDYHQDLDDYFAAKSRLFLEILANGGGSRAWRSSTWTTPGAGSSGTPSGSPPHLRPASRTARCGP